MEDYLCSSCTHVCGSYNFSAALDRLEIASKLGMLESAVKMEQILMLRPTKIPFSMRHFVETNFLLGDR
jgi:hypothetical protein